MTSLRQLLSYYSTKKYRTISHKIQEMRFLYLETSKKQLLKKNISKFFSENVPVPKNPKEEPQIGKSLSSSRQHS